MKYGGGEDRGAGAGAAGLSPGFGPDRSLPRLAPLASSVIARLTSSCKVRRPAGGGAPPPDSGSARSIRRADPPGGKPERSPGAPACAPGGVLPAQARAAGRRRRRTSASEDEDGDEDEDGFGGEPGGMGGLYSTVREPSRDG